MIFVAADSCRSQLENLTQILVSSFPGSTIYQHTDLFRVPHNVLNNKVDAVFLEAENDKTNSLSLMKELRRHKPNLPVFIISKTNAIYNKSVAAGANGCFVLPDEQQQLVEAIRAATNKELITCVDD